MKKLLAILLLAVMVLPLAACMQNDENTLYYLNFKPESAAALQKIAQKYTHPLRFRWTGKGFER